MIKLLAQNANSFMIIEYLYELKKIDFSEEKTHKLQKYIWN